MKITLELNTDVMTEAQREAFIKVLAVSSFILEVGTDNKDPATDLDAPEDHGPSFDPDARIYGEKGEKARRTKEEIARDNDIEERWRALWPSKGVPAKPVGELEAHITKIELEQQPADEEEGFDVGDEEATDEPEVMDLDEFRAILNKAMKALGGKTVGGAMKPHKSATDVPAEDRQKYADELRAMMEEA